MITSPKLEERYIVLKIRDLKAADALQATREFLRTNGIKTIDCVVVEADWPQYRTVVDMIIPDQSQQSAPAGLVERLRSYIPNGDGYNSQYANDLAEAVELLAAAPKAEQPPVQCPAYSERIVPAPTALIQWAWEDEPESTLFDEGYNAARRWVKMQLEYAVSKAPQPVSDDVAKDALEKRLDSARQLLICISATQPEWEPQISEWMMGSK